MKLAILDGLSQIPITSLDIETYSPQGFPHDAEDPIVSVSLAQPLCGDPRWGVELSSVVCHPSLEPRLLRILSSLLNSRLGGILLTYNGLRFDLPYLKSRADRYGIELSWKLDGMPHIDLYQLVRGWELCLPSYRQKEVEEFLGIRRHVADVNGGNYYRHYQNFLKKGDIKPILYNIEDALLIHMILYILKRGLKRRIMEEG
ncbi:ribonuclease H-like domain-containing protein [Candidatus Bathyarchaeota archaeon]|nr:ribonuclease H-like domain-containing protein [Candidatus Bathyarchaeota archaeon]